MLFRSGLILFGDDLLEMSRDRTVTFVRMGDRLGQADA